MESVSHSEWIVRGRAAHRPSAVSMEARQVRAAFPAMIAKFDGRNVRGVAELLRVETHETWREAHRHPDSAGSRVLKRTG